MSCAVTSKVLMVRGYVVVPSAEMRLEWSNAHRNSTTGSQLWLLACVQVSELAALTGAQVADGALLAIVAPPEAAAA